MRRTLIIWNTSILLLLFVALGVTIRQIVRSSIYATVDRELAIRARAFVNNPPRPARSERLPTKATRRNPYKIHLYDLAGRSISPSGDFPLWDANAFRESHNGLPRTTTIERDGEPLRVLTFPVIRDGVLEGVLQAPYPVAEMEQAVGELDRALQLLFLPVVLSVWAAAVVLTNWVLAPVRRMIEATEHMGAGDLKQRLPVQGSDEFALLAHTFNGLLARLETAFLQQKQFTENASHELKTPLTRIKGTASMALIGPADPNRLSDALRRIDTASDTMAELVQDLLLLAQGDGGRLGDNRRTIDVKGLLERAREAVQFPASAPIHVEVEPELLTWHVNEAEFFRVIVNLLENAVRYTPSTGTVTVQAERDSLTVHDSGCGIATHHLAHLGERFYRVDEARARGCGGTGLGLAICRSIVQAHGGRISFTSVAGSGTTVRIHFQ